MFCPNCGREVSDNEVFCGVCGTKTVVSNETEILDDITNDYQAEDENQIIDEPKKKSNFFKSLFSKEKSLKSKIVTIVIAVVALLGIGTACTVLANGGFKNFYYRNFASPEAYLKYVLSKETDEAIDMFGKNYSEMMKSGSQGTLDVKLEVGDQLKTLMQASDTPLADIESIALSLGVAEDGDDQSLQMKANINDAEILTCNALLNLKDMDFYMQIPELSDKCVDFSSVLEESMGDVSNEELAGLEKLEDVMSNASTFTSIADTYLNIVYDNIEEAEKSKEKIEAEGVSQKCIKLETALDGKYAYSVAESAMEQLVDDDNIEEILKAISDEDYENYKNDLKEALDDLKENKDDIEDMDGEVTFAVYLNGKSEIVGTEMAFEDDLIISSIMPKKGSKFGYELYVESNNEIIVSITGDGTIKKDKLNGTYTVSVNEEVIDELNGYGKEIVTIEVTDLDMKSYEEGLVNGEFKVYTDKVEELKDYALSIEVNSSESKNSMSIDVMQKNNIWGTLTISFDANKKIDKLEPSESNTISIDNEYAVEEYAESLDIQGFVENAIEKSGIDITYSEIESMVNDLIDMYSYNNDYDDYDYDDYDYDDYDYDDYDYDDYDYDDYDYDDYDDYDYSYDDYDYDDYGEYY